MDTSFTTRKDARYVGDLWIDDFVAPRGIANERRPNGNQKTELEVVLLVDEIELYLKRVPVSSAVTRRGKLRRKERSYSYDSCIIF